jgi:hypothetical protein
MTQASANTHDEPSTRPPGRWLRLTQIVCVAVALLTGGLFVAGLPLYYDVLHTPCSTEACENTDQVPIEQFQRLERGSGSFSLGIHVAEKIATTVILALVSFAVGGILLWRRPDDRMALFVAAMVIIGGAAFASPSPMNLAASVHPVLVVVARILGTFAAFLYIFLYLFPDGRFVPRWTRWLTLGLIVVLVRPFLSREIGDQLFGPILLLFVTTGVYAQVYRYRHISTMVQRQQTKWAALGISTGMIGFLVIGSIFGLFPALVVPGTLSFFVLDILLYSFITLIPLSLGIAILRYRLYDIDIIIRRTLVYSVLTLTLGLVYLGCILMSRTLVAPLTGGSELAIVASTLAIAALFMPLRRRIQRVIDRRFFRRKYDAAKVLAAFGATARDETDLDALTAEMLRVVDETMQPEFVGLWLKETPNMERRG